MTISNSDRTAGPFLGNGINNTFPFSFKIFSRADLLVATTNMINGAETILTLDADYSVTMNPDQVNFPGGYITTAANLPTQFTLAMTSNIANVQTLDITNNGGFYPDQINGALDRIVVMVQQVAAKVGGGLNIGGAATVQLISKYATSAGATLIGFKVAILGAVMRTIYSKLAETKTWEDFGAVGDGVTLEDAAMNAATAWAEVTPFATIKSTPGARYLTNGVKVRFDNKFQDPTSTVTLDFTGAALIPAANNVVCVKGSRDFVRVIRPTVLNPNNRTGVIAYAFMPEDPTQTTKQASQQFCSLIEPVAFGVDVLYKQMPGPTVAGKASGSFYNKVKNPIGRNVACLIWLAGNPNALDVLNTRTTVKNPQLVGGNCLFWGEACDTTNVEGGSAENITLGAWPFATPTTIYIQQKFPNHTLDNNSVRFNGFAAETGRVPYNIAAFYCSLVNCDFIGHTLPSVGDQNRTSWENKGAVLSTSDRAGKLAMFAAKVLGGKQFYLALDGGGATKGEVFCDTGIKFSSPADIQDIRTVSVNGQYLGGNGMTLAIGGSGQNIQYYNLNNTGSGGHEFGGGIYVRPDTDNAFTLGTAARRWSTIYAATSTINTSDQDAKEQIGDIDPAALRAAARINFVQFKFKDAVVSKSDKARWHFGVIAQQVKEAFEAEGLDPFAYGLLCYDQWEDQFEPVVAQRDVEKIGPDGMSRTVTEAYHTGEMKLVQAAGSRYGVRHDELFALCMAVLFSRTTTTN